jgi:hypothetical protein
MKIYSGVALLLSTTCIVLASSSSVDLSNTFCQQKTDVDIHRFTQLLSNHLLFDHFDKAYYQLSRKISFQFRDAIQVKVKKIKSKTATTTTTTTTTTTADTAIVSPPVDVQILKRQLKGAVGCEYSAVAICIVSNVCAAFVEDKLPAILTNRYNITSLQNQLDHLLYQYCPDKPNQDRRIVSHQCLLDNRESFLKEIHTYTTHELQSTLLKVNEQDLPRLFEKTRAQISGILIHFNQHTMDTNYHRLELNIKSAKTTSNSTNSLSLPSSYYNNNKLRNWITPEMIQEFISTVNHTDNEEGNTIQQFIELSM